MLAAPLWAGFEDVGIGARPLGMGGAFAAIADDSNAVYWNPAGMVQVNQQQAMFMHGVYGSVSDVNFDYLSYVYPMKDWALGLGWSQAGTTLEEGAEATTSRMSEDMYYLAVGVNPALFGNDILSVGATLKRLQVSSKVSDSSGVGFDAGALLRPVPWLQAAFTMRNLGSNVGDESLKPNLRFGLGSRLFTDRLRLAADLSSEEGDGDGIGTTYKWHAGAEIQPWPVIALRLGADNGAFTAGAGLSLYSFMLDYGYSNSDLFGSLHRVSLGLSFGPDGKAFVEPAALAAAKAEKVKPPTGLRGGYMDGRVMLFWDASESADVMGYNVYLKLKGEWTKVNDSLILPDKRAAGLDAVKGDTYELAVTSVRVDKAESRKGEPVTVLAR
jgi:hypothetical protein